MIGVATTLAVWLQGTQWIKSPEKAFGVLQKQTVLQQHSVGIADHVVAQASGFAPSSVYGQGAVHGFTLLINPEVMTHKAAAQEIWQELNWQLLQITRVIPAKPLATLQKVRIWVEWEKRKNGAAEFHPSAEWLRQNGYNPEKAGCVEVANTRNFVLWSRTAQPWMLLHELAHAYHHHILGDGHAGIEAAYKHAVDRKLYESVAYIQGGKKQAYALTNSKEYFAELSESYFGKNDFYPFTRAELKRHDPVGYHLMEQAWGNPRGTDR
ncbi:hypothetical protein C7B82_01435 [Stenomitos frigidus ULC18]|uniref:Metallopeptidase n=2 Tax=Stenomitos TaxID=1844270 RepID=A0A2T1ER12_9CYAN|nr:hypothetical protein C7B82_01435 [Stenomitos frigidus ULC18]